MKNNPDRDEKFILYAIIFALLYGLYSDMEWHEQHTNCEVKENGK